MRSFFAAAVVAAVAGLLPTSAIDAAARTLTLAIALMAAGVFPCMTLAVNAMKGEEKSPAMVQDLYEQLRKLLKVLVAAFVLAVLAVLSLVFIAAAIATDVGHWPVKGAAVLAGFTLGLFMARVLGIGKAFFVLLEINKKHALLVARKQIRVSRESVLQASRREELPKDDPVPRKLRKVV